MNKNIKKTNKNNKIKTKNKNKNIKNLEKQNKNISSQVKKLTKQFKSTTIMPSKRRNKNAQSSSSMGAKIGSQVGDFLQKGATALFKSVTGFGDYKVKSNTLLSGASPAVFRGGDRSTVVRHREYVQDIVGSTAFNSTAFAVNPANASLFPWLASIATCYEQYKIHGMIFEYKSTSADALNSTNTALGTVIMATDYNVLNPSFSTKIQMENFEFATSCKPSESCLHPLECDPSQTPTNEFYTSTGSAGGDARFVNMANFQIATYGMQAQAVIGELWLSFEIELIKPRLGQLALVQTLGMQYTGVTSTNYFAVGSNLSYNNNFPSLPAGSTSSLTFTGLVVGGIYSVRIVFYGNATSGLIAPTVTGGSGYALFNTIISNNTGTSMSTGTTTDSNCFTAAAFTVNAPVVVLSYGASTLPTSCNSSMTVVRLA